MKKILSVLTLILALFLVGCSNDNENAENETKGKRVAVYDMGVLDIMHHVGYDKFDINALSIPEYLSRGELTQYADFGGPDLGNHRDPSIEPLKLLQPDVVILTGRFRTLEEAIKKEFPNAVIHQAAVEPTDYLNSIKHNIDFLAKTFPDAAVDLQAVMDELTEDVNNLHAKTANIEDKALVLLPNGKSLASYGSGGRFDMIHSAFGFKDALVGIDANAQLQAASEQAHGNNINFEFFTQVNPDIVFLVDRNVSSGDGSPSESVNDMLNSSAFKATNAFKNSKVINLDPNAFYVYPGGYTTTKQMIKDLSNAL